MKPISERRIADLIFDQLRRYKADDWEVFLRHDYPSLVVDTQTARRAGCCVTGRNAYIGAIGKTRKDSLTIVELLDTLNAYNQHFATYVILACLRALAEYLAGHWARVIDWDINEDTPRRTTLEAGAYIQRQVDWFLATVVATTK